MSTKDRLWRMQMVPNQECLLCAGADETVSHLFFQCAVSKECFEGIKKWL